MTTPLTPMTPAASPVIYVELNGHGAWKVVLPEPGRRVTCQTLEDARRMAYQCAQRRRPCQVVVRDGYHRVLQHELIGPCEDVSQPAS
jgi:hypothetical protein